MEIHHAAVSLIFTWDTFFPLSLQGPIAWGIIPLKLLHSCLLSNHRMEKCGRLGNKTCIVTPSIAQHLLCHSVQKRTAVWVCVCVCVERGPRFTWSAAVDTTAAKKHQEATEHDRPHIKAQAPHLDPDPPPHAPRLLPSGHTWQRGHPAPSKRDWETRDTNKRLDTFSYSDLMVWNFCSLCTLSLSRG